MSFLSQMSLYFHHTDSVSALNQLMKALDAFAQEKNLYGITLEVRVSNNAAIALYEKNGYEKSGIRKGFYSKPRKMLFP